MTEPEQPTGEELAALAAQTMLANAGCANS